VSARAPLTVADLARLAAVAVEATDPRVVFAAADRLVAAAIGHRLFTVTGVHHATQEVERLYTSDPVAYPVGGRKSKRNTDWGRIVLAEGRVFVAATPEEVRRHFADHARLAGLGIGAILNVPITAGGCVRGVMNVSHQAGWFTAEDVERGRVIAGLLAAAFLVAAPAAAPAP
jgi:GAF domain-containing protein